MSDLRETLKRNGWKQGVIILPTKLIEANTDHIGYMVLTQTCDCINRHFDTEPHLELLPLRKLRDGELDKQLINARNPRRIHFELTEQDKSLWVSAQISEVLKVDRSEHESLCISSKLKIAQHIIDDIIMWRAARYLRTAFPDAFEEAFRENKIAAKFSAKIKKHAAHIERILIGIDPFKEISADEPYDIQLYFMIEPETKTDKEVIKNLGILSDEIEILLASSKSFIDAQCHVQSLDEMSLHEAAKFLDFTRYDYLSFGEEG